MKFLRLLLAAGASLVTLQACTSTHQLRTTNDLDSSETLIVTTTAGEHHSVTTANLETDGSVRLPDSTLILRDSIASIEVSRIDYLKTAVITAGIAAGTYGLIWFIRLVRDLGSAPEGVHVNPKFPF